MGRRYEWPDPKDRSPNQPHILLEREAVLDLYQKDTGDDAKNLTEKVRDWFEDNAKRRDWDDVTWADQTAVLKKVWR
ncbi:hypothetical protein [Halochromatium roseum]|uniref:hypothetical protein n=1 Tax=Halochromatium roseum TaxID=391920 RepID=UPI001913BDDA|nr:hypothetical protein [Halochromatium roseum]